MPPAIDTSQFQLGVAPDEDAEEEGPLLDVLGNEARNFVESHRWAPPITDMLLAFGVGGILGLYLVRFAQGIEDGEGRGRKEIWVVVGDLPSVYFETDDIETPGEALRTYCNIAEDWAECVISDGDLSEVFPVEAAPTRENAEMLKSRIEFIRGELIPRA